MEAVEREVDRILDELREEFGDDHAALERRLVTALVFISQEAARERQGLRFAEPTPIHGVDAGLLILQLAADHALGRDTPLTRTLNAVAEGAAHGR